MRGIKISQTEGGGREGGREGRREIQIPTLSALNNRVEYVHVLYIQKLKMPLSLLVMSSLPPTIPHNILLTDLREAIV